MFSKVAPSGLFHTWMNIKMRLKKCEIKKLMLVNFII